MKQYACAVEIVASGTPTTGFNFMHGHCVLLPFLPLLPDILLEVKTDAFTEISMNGRTDAYTETDLKG